MDVTLLEPERKGWVCQKCGRSYSPLMMECSPCNEAVAMRFSGGRRVVEVKRRRL